MALESLNDHNARVQRQWAWNTLVQSRPNGIACPECGEELMDTNPNEMLLTAPPQFRVHCPSCEYSGTRF
jgi:hypothetical protein